MRLLKAAFFVCLLLTSHAVYCQSNLVLLVSQPGDYIGQGQTSATTNLTDFTVALDEYGLDVEAFGYDIWADGPGGGPLAVGSYTNAARDPFNGDGPGLSIFGNGRGCNVVCGSFQIYEFDTDTNGDVTHLWLTFTQYCECSSVALTGEIRYQSQLAPPAPPPMTIQVPSDYPTIQEGIDAASVLGYDTVLVSPGVYNESVDFNGKAVLLISAEGPAETVINPPGGLSAVTFTTGEGLNSVVSGFTISNGGVYISFSSPTVISNTIVGYSGIGVDLEGADSPLIQGNIIESNGGGIYMDGVQEPLIINNLIQNNSGDAIGAVNGGAAGIVQNVIVSNTGDGINALVPEGASGPVAINNTIVGNGGAGIYEDGFPAIAQIINNIVTGNPALNISPWDGTSEPAIQQRWRIVPPSDGPWIPQGPHGIGEVHLAARVSPPGTRRLGADVRRSEVLARFQRRRYPGSPRRIWPGVVWKSSGAS